MRSSLLIEVRASRQNRPFDFNAENAINMLKVFFFSFA